MPAGCGTSAPSISPSRSTSRSIPEYAALADTLYAGRCNIHAQGGRSGLSIIRRRSPTDARRAKAVKGGLRI
jgi:hypothetical protein